MRKIDRQLKACHNPLNDPNSKEYQQRKEAEKLKLAQAKAEKVGSPLEYRKQQNAQSVLESGPDAGLWSCNV